MRGGHGESRVEREFLVGFWGRWRVARFAGTWLGCRVGGLQLTSASQALGAGVALSKRRSFGRRIGRKGIAVRLLGVAPTREGHPRSIVQMWEGERSGVLRIGVRLVGDGGLRGRSQFCRVLLPV